MRTPPRKDRLSALALTAVMAAQLAAPYSYAAEPAGGDHHSTTTPIEHVIVIIGENRTFDNVYGTYVPKHGQKVSNLLSRGIVNADGSPGPNHGRARQFQIGTIDPVSYFISTTHLINPQKTAYSLLPTPEAFPGSQVAAFGGLTADLGVTLIVPLFSRIAEWTSSAQVTPLWRSAVLSSWWVSFARSITSSNSFPLWMRTWGRPSMIAASLLLRNVASPTSQFTPTRVAAEMSPPISELSPAVIEFWTAFDRTRRRTRSNGAS